MRIVSLAAVALALGACTPAAETPEAAPATATVTETLPQSEWDMGPMPPVAALYDRDAPPTTMDERSYYFTQDLAAALSAADTPVDFDYRSWANDPEIENQTFGLSESAPENRADVVTRFTYPGIGGGMIVTWTLCRKGPSEWKIENVAGQPVSDAPSDASDSDVIPSLRQMLDLPAQSPACD